MIVYSITEAKERLEMLLEEACREGKILIKRQDGRIFAVRPESQTRSALDVQGIALGLSKSDIVELVREGRERP
jgi:hypothetical protein